MIDLRHKNNNNLTSHQKSNVKESFKNLSLEVEDYEKGKSFASIVRLQTDEKKTTP